MDCQESRKSRPICTDSVEKLNQCSREIKCDKQDSATCGKVLRERLKKNRRRNSCQSSNKNGYKPGNSSGRRRYSQSSFLSNYPRGRAPGFGVLLSSDAVVRDVRASDATRRFYASCGKDDSKDSLCEKPAKKTCETTQEEYKNKCVKGPAQCLPKKSVPDKTCGSTREDKKPCDIPQQSKCSREQYCASRKGLNGKKDQSCGQRESLACSPSAKSIILNFLHLFTSIILNPSRSEGRSKRVSRISA